MDKTLNFFHPPRSIKNRKVVIGIDPGVTTGLSVMIVSDMKKGVESVMAWGSDQISYGGSGNLKDLYDGDEAFPEQEISLSIGKAILRWAKYNEVYVVIEDFIIRQQNSTRDFLAPVRITAGIMQSIFKNGAKVYVAFQSPSDAKGTCTDERMDAWGFPIKTQKDRHSRDADRHSILLLRKFMADPRVEKTLLSVPAKSAKRSTTRSAKSTESKPSDTDKNKE